MQIKDFLLSKKNEGKAKSTVIQMKNTISGIMNKAFDDEVIPANPAPSNQEKRGQPFWPTPCFSW